MSDDQSHDFAIVLTDEQKAAAVSACNAIIETMESCRDALAESDFNGYVDAMDEFFVKLDILTSQMCFVAKSAVIAFALEENNQLKEP